MPFYDYRCESCEHRFTKRMKMGAVAPPCEKCGSATKKTISRKTSFVLKGSGWAKDGYQG